jgi:ribonuclease III
VDDSLHAVAAAIGHDFADRSLLELALTHASFDPEQPEPVGSNGRLEFLGDAVLGVVVTMELYEAWDLSEGEMTKVRASVVNEATLAEVAASVGVGSALRLGRGEDAAGGRHKMPILADAMEAVIAAVFVDAGYQRAADVVLALWRPIIAERAAVPGERDYKTILQETLATMALEPRYEVDGRGPDHQMTFEAVVVVEGEVVGRGTGTSKKRAQHAAARDALTHLRPSDA